MGTKTLIEYENEYASLLSSDVPITEIETKNIFDLSGFPHYETVWSNLYAYFLKDDEEHGLKDLFLSALLSLINKQTLIFQNLKSFDSFSVEREIITKNGNYIDLLIYQEDENSTIQNAIIIENKVNAALNNDLSEYFNSIKAKNKIGIVLSINPVNANHKDYINILHNDWLNAVLNQPISYLIHCDLKQILYLQEFYSNIHSYNSTNNMKDAYQFYMNHESKIEQIITLRDDVIKNVLEKIALGMQEFEFKKGKYYIKSAYIDFKNDDYTFYLHFHIDKLFSKKELKILCWLNNDFNTA